MKNSKQKKAKGRPHQNFVEAQARGGFRPQAVPNRRAKLQDKARRMDVA